MKNQDLYFIAIMPPESIQKEITAVKNDFAFNYHSKHALKSPPHVTLYMPFKWDKSEEEELVNELFQFAIGHEPFPLELKNFGCFAPRVIYVDIIVNDSLKSLHHGLLEVLSKKLNLFDKKEWERPYHPHMTVAHRDLKQSAFKKAWKKYENEYYDRIFEVNSFSLLKHNGRKWEEFKTFYFSD